MIDSRWRHLYQSFIITPLLKQPWIVKQNPKRITFYGLFLGLSIPFFLKAGLQWAALIALIFSGFFDTLDGSIARTKKIASPVGAALDITADRIVEFSVVLGLYLLAPKERGLLCLFMLGSILLCITTFLVVGIFSQKRDEKSFHYSAGWMERTEAFLFFSAMILLPSAFTLLASLFSLLVTMTALMRLHAFSSTKDFR